MNYNYNEEGLNLDKLNRQELRKINKNKRSNRIVQILKNREVYNFDKKLALDMLSIWKKYDIPEKEFISMDSLESIKSNVKFLE